MNAVAIQSIDVKVLTQKIGFPQLNFLRSLTQPKIKRQLTFEPTDI